MTLRGGGLVSPAMRAVIQRVRSASVKVGDEKVAAIERGLLVLLGVEETDAAGDIEWLAGKVAGLRLFADAAGAWNRSVARIRRAGAEEIAKVPGIGAKLAETVVQFLKDRG